MGTTIRPIRNRSNSWQRCRCWCLAWLILCQFPIPFAHSHDSLAGIDPVACHAHLRLHHAGLCGTNNSSGICCMKHAPAEDHVHWHWLLPGELLHGNADPGEGHPALPVCSTFGLWGGATGFPAELVQVACSTNSMVSIDCVVRSATGLWFETWSSATLQGLESRHAGHMSSRFGPWSSFTSSYGVPPQALLCVSLA